MSSPKPGRKPSKQKGKTSVSPAVDKTKRSRKPKVAQEGDFKLIEAEGKTIEEVVETVKVAKKRGAPRGNQNAAGHKGVGPKKVREPKVAREPKKKGPKSIYNAALGELIYERLADGESLFSICKDDGMPSERTVRRWALDLEHPFSPKYTQAREIGYLKLADELLEIADNGSNDWMERNGEENAGWVANGEAIARSRLRVDTRKWLLSKCLPKVYGDKLELGSDPDRPIKAEMTFKVQLVKSVHAEGDKPTVS